MINVTKEIEHLHKLAKREPGKRFNHLWDNLISMEWLTQAWEQIRNNKGSQTVGIDQMTAVDVDLELISKLAEELKDGRYQPKPVRRVYIPKANGKTRPLGIATIKDRIVQQGLKMLLEPIFEADFYNCSHGFRQGRSAHTALRDVSSSYSGTTWLIEADIESYYDSIPHGELMEEVGRRITDEKVLHLIKLFLQAGYLEDWHYHQTYSGIPQGNIVGPLWANIFLHQFDEYLVKELKANRVQTSKEQVSRRNPEYMKIDTRLYKLRKKLKKTGDREIIKEIERLERERKNIPYYDKNKRHPCKIKYVRYADDALILIAGTREEAEIVRDQIKEKLSEMGLRLSEEKTKITHWSQKVRFLGYQIHGELRDKGVGIRAVLSIPHEKVRKVKDTIERICSIYHIPEVDLLVQVNAIYRGWCNYYRYANNPQPVFNELSRFMWWQYAHFLARKQKSSIAGMIKRERKAGRLGVTQRGNRKRNTFRMFVGKKAIVLEIFPPQTGQIRALPGKQDWKVDLKPVTPMNWPSGRSFATRLEALDRANGVCEKCKERPVSHVHHTIPMRKKSFLARVSSDSDQRYTARALCSACHLEEHGGSFNPKRQQSSVNAGCAQKCLPSVGSAG